MTVPAYAQPGGGIRTSYDSDNARLYDQPRMVDYVVTLANTRGVDVSRGYRGCNVSMDVHQSSETNATLPPQMGAVTTQLRVADTPSGGTSPVIDRKAMDEILAAAADTVVYDTNSAGVKTAAYLSITAPTRDGEKGPCFLVDDNSQYGVIAGPQLDSDIGNTQIFNKLAFARINSGLQGRQNQGAQNITPRDIEDAVARYSASNDAPLGGASNGIAGRFSRYAEWMESQMDFANTHSIDEAADEYSPAHDPQASADEHRSVMRPHVDEHYGTVFADDAPGQAVLPGAPTGGGMSVADRVKRSREKQKFDKAMEAPEGQQALFDVEGP